MLIRYAPCCEVERGLISQARVRSYRIVVLVSLLNQNLRVPPIPESVQWSGTQRELPVGVLVCPVLPRLARFDQRVRQSTVCGPCELRCLRTLGRCASIEHKIICPNFIRCRRPKRFRAVILRALARLLGWYLETCSCSDTGTMVPTNAHPITGQENPGSS